MPPSTTAALQGDELDPWMPVDPFDPDLPLDPFAGPGGDGVFSAVPVLMGILLAVFVGVLVVRLTMAGHTHATNSSLPQQSVAARVVGKRTQTQGGHGDTGVQTRYFATFELTSGERTELKVPPQEYGLLADGDEGRLTHQGTWYRGFERRRVIPLDGTWEAPGGPSLPAPPQA